MSNPALGRAIASIGSGAAIKPRDRDQIAHEQQRCDTILRGFGERDHAPEMTIGESSIGYRLRLANLIQHHSPSYSGAHLYRYSRSDEATVNPILEQLYLEAEASMLNGNGSGELRAVTRADKGREITSFYGDPMVWMAPFMGNTARFGRFRRPKFAANEVISGSWAD